MAKTAFGQSGGGGFMMNVALVFTFGMSVEQWHKQGLLDRERRIYEKLLASNEVAHYVWLTYGTDDLRFQSELNPKITIVSMPRVFKGKIGIWIYSFLMPLIQRRWFKKVDLIKTNQMKGAWTAVLASKWSKRPLYLRTGFTWSLLAKKGIKRWMTRMIERYCYRNANIASVTSRHQYEYLVQTYGINPEKLILIPNYVDVDHFKPSPNTTTLPERVVYVGRLHEVKNLFNLIEAFAETPYTLDLYYGDDTIKGQLEAQAERLNVNLEFKGAVPNKNLPAILNQYELFVLPSHRENMPKSLIEAMACGRCVLGTDVPGINELIDHGKTGWLTGTDSQSLRKAIQTLMENESLRKFLGENAADYVRTNFSVETVMEKERQLYQSVVSANPNPERPNPLPLYKIR